MNYYHPQWSQHHISTRAHSIFSLVLEIDPLKRGTVWPTDTDLNVALEIWPPCPCLQLPDSPSHPRKVRVAVNSCICRLFYWWNFFDLLDHIIIHSHSWLPLKFHSIVCHTRQTQPFQKGKFHFFWTIAWFSCLGNNYPKNESSRNCNAKSAGRKYFSFWL